VVLEVLVALEQNKGLMKILKILPFLLLSISVFGQSSDIEAVSQKACNCLDKVSQGLVRTKMYEEIKSCIESSITTEQLMSKLLGASNEIKKDSMDRVNALITGDSIAPKEINITIVMDLDYEEVEEHLLRNCARMQRLMTTENRQSEVSVSDKKSALKLYDEGMDVYRAKDYEGAIAKFKKAIKKDRNFAYAYDMVGISYRRLDDYKNALKYYNKSIKLDPGGRMPLMNIPIAYALMNDYKKSIEGYLRFIEVFPDDPEGFYGIGRIYHLLGDYENAVDNMMKSYVMYNEIESPYARDAESNLSLFYRELKEKGELDLFTRMAKKHKIDIGE
jgi:tetratricopeptide (TPR) repeat protein